MRFRERSQTAPVPFTLDDVRRTIGHALSPAHFFVNGVSPLWQDAGPEVIFWEVFRGRLLDAAQTRQQQTFAAWNVYLVEGGLTSAEPILSVKLDAAAGLVHVVRAIHSYAWEGYDAGGSVILSREVRKWVRELVGTIHLGRFRDLDDLRDELICLLFRAVVGLSRLPLTSVEAPLPQFSLGQVAYFNRPNLSAEASDIAPLTSYRGLVDHALTDDLSWLEKAKLLETFLHAVPRNELGLGEAAELFMVRWRNLKGVAPTGFSVREVAAAMKLPDKRAQQDCLARIMLATLFRTLFNEVSLSPYTALVDKALAFLGVLEGRGHLTPAEVADLLGHLLRQLGRHLTAFDLVAFHHRGANYPDALFLDDLLKDYLHLIDWQPGLFLDEPDDHEGERKQKRLRRRALRQGWLLRTRYEEHPVPDAPTSPGENARILPPPHVRVPEEQILQPERRTRRLFADDPLTHHLRSRGQEVLRQSIRDLEHPNELRELGMALFLDRPLGIGKSPKEPDQTPLLSYEAFSRSIAERRLQELADSIGFAELEEYEKARQRLQLLEIKGISASVLADTARPAIVSLADALKTADDFVILRNTYTTALHFFEQYLNGSPALWSFALDDLGNWGAPVLIVGRAPIVSVYDDQLRKRLELEVDTSQGYAIRAGVEYPVAGLRVLRAWEETDEPGQLREHDLQTKGVVIRPRV